MQPLVSIYIPTKNRPSLLKRAVLSCLAQSYVDLDIIIVDDASDEAFLPEILSVAALDPRIRFMRQEPGAGACAARNKAIFGAKGEFITGLDDDDEFEPDRIAVFVSQWLFHPSTSFLSSGYQIHTKTMSFSYGGQARVIRWHDLLFANHVGNQLFTKTSYLQAIEGFDIRMPSCQDYDAWLRLAQHFGPGYRIAHSGYIVHQEHDAPRISQSSNKEQGYQMLLDKHRVYMSQSQLRSQLFYRALNTQSWTAIELIKLAGRQTMGVALKNIVLRWARRRKGDFA